MSDTKSDADRFEELENKLKILKMLSTLKEDVS
jgi:hypothetical protein